jgi:hypothetical protein
MIHTFMPLRIPLSDPSVTVLAPRSRRAACSPCVGKCGLGAAISDTCPKVDRQKRPLSLLRLLSNSNGDPTPAGANA